MLLTGEQKLIRVFLAAAKRRKQASKIVGKTNLLSRYNLTMAGILRRFRTYPIYRTHSQRKPAIL